MVRIAKYVNLAYEYEVDGALNPPTEQHNEYKWFALDELLESKQVHKYVKEYFRNQMWRIIK